MVEDHVCCGFVEDAPLTVRLQVQFERLELDTAFVGDIGDVNGAEVGLPRLRTYRGKLGTIDGDSEISPRIGVGEGLNRGIRHNRDFIIVLG